MVAGKLTAKDAADRMRSAFEHDPAMSGLFLGGSHGRGTADEWSDLDFVALADEPNQDALAARWLDAVRDAGPVVHTVQRRQGPSLLLNIVTADWLRIDLLLVPPALFAGGRSRDGVAVLFDRNDAAASLPPTLPPRAPDPARVRHLTTEFLRVLGLLPVVVGRGEWVVAAAGTAHLRGFVQELLVEASSVPDRGGALGLARVLSSGDRELLAGLPHPPPGRDDVIRAHVAIARAFLPRARALYDRLGLDWPDAFEEATRRRLLDTVGGAAVDLVETGLNRTVIAP